MRYKDIISRIADISRIIFLNPNVTYSWDKIVQGVQVGMPDGTSKTMAAVEKNTWRGFHKIDKQGPGAKIFFHAFFLQNKQRLLTALKNVSSFGDIDEIADTAVNEIKYELRNIKPNMLTSYNKLRKPVDLYLEHLVSLASEFGEEREQIVKFLPLPLDSQIFSLPWLFTESELSLARLSRKSTYSNVKNKSDYLMLQSAILKKASTISKNNAYTFYPIFFDLAWNHRYDRKGTNLFQTNP